MFPLIFFVFVAAIRGHTWIDCIDHSYDVVYTNSNRWVYGGSNGHGVCEGYARGYPGRGNRDINTLFTYKMQHQAVANGAQVCQFSRSQADYNGWRKMTKANAGDKLYFAYFPNGHVAKDKMARETQYGIYWSGQSNTELQKTTDLQGHVLGGLHSFDDGNCGETTDSNGNPSGRAGDGHPCIGSFTIPSGTPSGVYQFIYFWTFYRTDASQVVEQGYYGAAYSSCFDVEVTGTGNPPANNPSPPASNPPSPPANNPPSPPANNPPSPPANNPPSPPANNPPSPPANNPPSPPANNPPSPPANNPPSPPANNPPSPPANNPPSPPSDDPTPPSKCSGFWGPCHHNNVYYECTIGSTCTRGSAHYSQCVPDEVAFGKSCNTASDCPAGWICDETCKLAPKQCTGTVSTTTLSVPVSDSSSSIDPPSSSGTIDQPTATVLAAATYTNVGGVGSYGRVSHMEPGIFGEACPSNKCVQEDYSVSGKLAPFNDEVGVAFRGPIDIKNIGVYEPSGNAYKQVSSFTKGEKSKNLVFLNNRGDASISGEWTTCGGNSQSYATSDGTKPASSPQSFNGYIDGSTEVNIMSAKKCTGNNCGFTRGTAYHGWKGSNDGDKLFIIKASMPTQSGPNIPAIWMLHADVFRTAQYGCNCRGIGTEGRWKGGCGELDIAEVLHSNPSKLTSTMYTFKGARGAGEYANRPENGDAIFVVIFDSAGDRIQILMLNANDVNFDAKSISQSTVNNWLGKNGKTVNFNI